MVSTQNWRISPIFISYYVSQSRALENEHIMNDILFNLIYNCSSVTNNKHRIFNCLSKSKALDIQYIMSDIIFDITYNCLSVMYNKHRISHCLSNFKALNIQKIIPDIIFNSVYNFSSVTYSKQKGTTNTVEHYIQILLRIEIQVSIYKQTYIIQ